MKTFAVLAVVIAAVSLSVNAAITNEAKEKLRALGKTCLAETGADFELVKKARDGNFVDDTKLKAFARCMAVKVGFLDASGEPVLNVIREKLTIALDDAALANTITEKCAVKKVTPEDSVFESFKCYYVNTPTHYNIF